MPKHEIIALELSVDDLMLAVELLAAMLADIRRDPALLRNIPDDSNLITFLVLKKILDAQRAKDEAAVAAAEAIHKAAAS